MSFLPTTMRIEYVVDKVALHGYFGQLSKYTNIDPPYRCFSLCHVVPPILWGAQQTYYSWQILFLSAKLRFPSYRLLIGPHRNIYAFWILNRFWNPDSLLMNNRSNMTDTGWPSFTNHRKTFETVIWGSCSPFLQVYISPIFGQHQCYRCPSLHLSTPNATPKISSQRSRAHGVICTDPPVNSSWSFY